MSFIRISSRHSDKGCLFVSIGMIVSTILFCGTIIYVVNHTDPIIEKFSEEAGIILDEVPDLVVETIQRVNNPNLESPEVAKPAEGIYSVKEGDRAYFQIDVEDLITVANPCFRLNRIENEKSVQIDQTPYIKDSSLASTKDPISSNLRWNISKNDLQKTKCYRIDVLSARTENYLGFEDHKRDELLKGDSYPADELKKWMESKPKDLLTLNIKSGGSVKLKYVEEKGEYFIVQIVEYKIPMASIPAEKLKNLKKEIEIQVLDSSGKVVPQENGEYLLTCFENYSVRIPDGQSTQTVRLENLFDRLNTHFKNSKGKAGPVYFLFNDSTSGNKLKATFRGIHRSYMVSSVTIPENTDYRGKPRIKPGFFGHKGGVKEQIFTKLEIRILQNGSLIFKTFSEVPGWSLDFPVSEKNKFSIREGVGKRYLVQIIHDGHPITELCNLTDLNFNQEIKEDDNQKKWQLLFPGTISMKFELVK